MQLCRFALSVLFLTCVASRVHAQDPPPPIGPFVVDIRATFPRFPDSVELAQSRGLELAQLPGAGLGVDVGVHLYGFKWKVVTFGLGAQLTLTRAHASGQDGTGTRVGSPVTERFTHIAPQLSLNFGTGDGWSYLSGGFGPSTWSIVPDGDEAAAPDEARLGTVNYGGGARWFTRRRVAFHFDVRFYQIPPGTASATLPGSPDTRLLILGAGVSLR
jgi:hypothetical protein